MKNLSLPTYSLSRPNTVLDGSLSPVHHQALEEESEAEVGGSIRLGRGLAITSITNKVTVTETFLSPHVIVHR